MANMVGTKNINEQIIKHITLTFLGSSLIHPVYRWHRRKSQLTSHNTINNNYSFLSFS